MNIILPSDIWVSPAVSPRTVFNHRKFGQVFVKMDRGGFLLESLAVLILATLSESYTFTPREAIQTRRLLHEKEHTLANK